MPRVNVPVTSITRTGIAPATEVNGDATNNHSLTNNGTTWLMVRNSGSTVARVVSAIYENTVDGQTVPAKTWSIPTSSTRYIGPFPVRLFGTLLLIDVDNAELKLSAYTLPATT
ncbi:hypothetical protein [Streptomyces albireticuli]|uniref:Uncharacterized protein n=1 Tax=Streptomyces albireticuli TaxID=1940 RepID=A0A2A2D3S5_9ACTN|nr:hypothetical protein [Streptomyces albireticuli]MCD9196062.1 hypothetical protein [Streptomyces albireticuli]PAU46184.1 hypothetical protein CK936_25655 [Streptomyces albireticuli]